MSDALFDTQDTNFISEISQKARLDDLLNGPFPVDARCDELILGFETLSAHCVDKTCDLSLVRNWSVTLPTSEPHAHWRIFWI